MDNSNQLLHFLTAATTNLQEALSKPTNMKKVNHCRYIQKRLQKRDNKKISSTNKKSSTPPTTVPKVTPTQTTPLNNARPHPVATLPHSSFYWQPSPINGYPTTYNAPSTAITPPLSNSPSSSLNSTATSGYTSRPQSQPSYDPDFESLLTEIGLETSPSPQYSDTTRGESSLSRQPSLNTVHWETYLPPNEFIPSPHSDFSDVDDSAYSSPCNPSPIYYPIQVCSPPNSVVTSTTTSYHHVATGSCEWLPPAVSCGTLPSTHTHHTATAIPAPSFLNMTPTLGVPSSLNEILELVTP